MFFAFVCILGCNNGTTSKDINYYIPNGYKGVVVIVFEEKEKTVFNEYKIPKNGILYFPYTRNEGIFIPKYFYVDKKGNRIKEVKKYALEKYHNDLKANTSYILDEYDGRFSVKSKNDTLSNPNYYSTNNMKMIDWLYFTIGTDESQSYELRKKANKIIDSLQQQIVK